LEPPWVFSLRTCEWGVSRHRNTWAATVGGCRRRAYPDATVDEVTAAWVASAAGLFRPRSHPCPVPSHGASMKEVWHGEAAAG